MERKMEGLATVSLNYSDGDKVIIGATDNPPEIIAECIKAANEGKTVYFISQCWNGCVIMRRHPGRKTHDYVALYRNNEYTWTHDYLYAKPFSKQTAIKHIKELIMRGE